MTVIEVKRFLTRAERLAILWAKIKRRYGSDKKPDFVGSVDREGWCVRAHDVGVCANWLHNPGRVEATWVRSWIRPGLLRSPRQFIRGV
jgi:hypothetical protein